MASEIASRKDLGMEQNRYDPPKVGKEPRARASRKCNDIEIVSWMLDEASWLRLYLKLAAIEEQSRHTEAPPLPSVSLLNLAFAFSQKPNNNRSLQD
jgi:hypothetical protein